MCTFSPVHFMNENVPHEMWSSRPTSMYSSIHRGLVYSHQYLERGGLQRKNKWNNNHAPRTSWVESVEHSFSRCVILQNFPFRYESVWSLSAKRTFKRQTPRDSQTKLLVYISWLVVGSNQLCSKHFGFFYINCRNSPSIKSHRLDV